MRTITTPFFLHMLITIFAITAGVVFGSVGMAVALWFTGLMLFWVTFMMLYIHADIRREKREDREWESLVNRLKAM